MPRQSDNDPAAVANRDCPSTAPELKRRGSSSQQSETSQTAAEFIRDQMQLEADAREALPYSIQNCTNPLGSLRQSVFSCLTCNPPPDDPKAPYDAAGVCYSCSVQCHGEHTLVEIFNKRNFTCDCGTTRFPTTSPCNLRVNEATNTKGVHSETPAPDNKYNQNFRNRFCGCECDYDPFQQKGTMFQCLGLGTHETGGCGEDWWHPGCVVGLGPKWFENMESRTKPAAKAEPKTPADVTANGASSDSRHPLPAIAENEDAEPQNQMADAPAREADADDDDDDPPMPPGFPDEESFEAFLCYKCVDAYQWVRRYAGTEGFHPAVFSTQNGATPSDNDQPQSNDMRSDASTAQKRKAEDEDEETQQSKRHKTEEAPESGPPDGPSQSNGDKSTSTEDPKTAVVSKPICKLDSLPPAPPNGQFSLFLKETFRENLCRCPACFPLLKPHPQLLEEEETYEPPVSEDGGSEHGGSTQGSLLEMGESALRNVDRVRAIEGVMAYNHLKEKLKTFLQPFAQSGEAVSAEDIKEIFAKLRGDDKAIKEAAQAATQSDSRREQRGY